LKLLIGELQPSTGQQNRNGRLRIACGSRFIYNLFLSRLGADNRVTKTDFAQHHIDSLDLTLNSVAFLAKMFPGKSEQEYRQHLGAFGITVGLPFQLVSFSSRPSSFHPLSRY
jgi:ATP-binding cassette subfamily F protein 3